MRDLDLKSLRLLVSACDNGSIKLAAQRENIEPSAISKRIAQLESDLGASLLRRGRRGVEATPAGLALLSHARNMLFAADRIRAEIATFSQGVKGYVKLVASPSAIAESLLDDVAEFMSDEANKSIQIDIEERYSTEIVQMVAEGSASLGVCWDRINFGNLQTRAYRSDHLALAVPRTHPLVRFKRMAFEQALTYDHVGLPPTTAVHTLMRQAAAAAGQLITYRAIVSNFDAELRVVAAGLGISVIPSEIAERHSLAGSIHTVRLSNAWATRRFAVCYKKPIADQPALAHLISFLSDLAPQTPRLPGPQ